MGMVCDKWQMMESNVTMKVLKRQHSLKLEMDDQHGKRELLLHSIIYIFFFDSTRHLIKNNMLLSLRRFCVSQSFLKTKQKNKQKAL